MGGFFGVAARVACTTDLFYGTDYHSHLGTKRGGMATLDQDKRFSRSIHNIEGAYFRNKFELDLPKFKGDMGIGIISDTDSQPIVIHSHLGPFAICAIGKITNIDALVAKLLKRGNNFTELSSGDINPTEVVGQLLTLGGSFEEGIRLVQESVEGSCSMLLLTPQGVIAARDRYGRTPIVWGQREEGDNPAIAFASESCSFPNLGFEYKNFLAPGEAIIARWNGVEQILPPLPQMKVCAFLWTYYGYPTSCYEGINVDNVRYECGRLMGLTDTAVVDHVCCIPDSGSCMAIGYATGKGVPYRHAVVKYTPTWPRSFLPATQERRDLVAHMKLIPNRSVLEGCRLAVCDDSIVRGTQLRDNARMLYHYGAQELHVRISCPPLLYPCPFINFSGSRSVMELICRRYIASQEGRHDAHLEEYANPDTQRYHDMVTSIGKTLHVDSLLFNPLQNLIKAIGLPKDQVCTHCFDGQ